MKEGIISSYHLFDLADDNSKKSKTEFYSYVNKGGEHKVRISRTEGSGNNRELEMKTIPLEAYKQLCMALVKIHQEEQKWVSSECS